ncbi:SgcJ/EcaC family oxidoreductase [Streptomyces millisiae]|uniref:SgcJ/EcaC family oxidoreductase n=1 Tax=Streptomyces millisiae TaxID=3075542 RepID=A0ABU2LTC7_9ACTN|nr:SgcJ/EcaC family oxidoreductase [Streptomyces sp. DSM 44918]MDT0320837.1 SgcJ/EcaC family oxidoreductase [Streptomyces sp. DSM 44918]
MRKITFTGRHTLGAAALITAGLLTAGAAATASASGQSSEDTASHHQPTEQEIRDLFVEWNEALATGDPEVVADRYAEDAVLEPTLSNVIRTDRDGIVDYFEHFLAQDPEGEIDESYVDILARNAAVDSGAYTFHLTDPATGEQRDVAARYTFVYEKDPATGEWLIVNHHSSAMPEG